MAVVTSGAADSQLGEIRQTGPAEVVDAYAPSGLEGIGKSDIGLFEITVRWRRHPARTPSRWVPEQGTAGRRIAARR
ncbi:hypothetical protein [Streptosporangium sp. NPDC004631]